LPIKLPFFLDKSWLFYPKRFDWKCLKHIAVSFFEQEEFQPALCSESFPCPSWNGGARVLSQPANHHKVRITVMAPKAKDKASMSLAPDQWKQRPKTRRKPGK
jgi:hypothetical protein